MNHILPNERRVHPSKRLGRRKPHLSKPRLKLAPFLTGVVPARPTAADHFAKVPQWGMYRNSERGTCGPTALANSRRLITQYILGTMDPPPVADVDDLYRRSGNPGYNPNDLNSEDNGVIVQDMLAEATKNGLGPHKLLGFAEVDHTNIDEIMAAIAIFGFVIFGSDLEVAQQSQTTLWDYSQSADWGGHATLGGRYKDDTDNTKDRVGNISWTQVIDLTDRFIDQQLEECWVAIWPEHLRDNAFLNGVNLQSFADAYKGITRREFPAVIPTPVPAPTPRPDPVTPTPAPVTELNFRLTDQAVVDRARSAALRAKMSDDEWLHHHLRSYFRMR